MTRFNSMVLRGLALLIVLVGKTAWADSIAVTPASAAKGELQFNSPIIIDWQTFARERFPTVDFETLAQESFPELSSYDRVVSVEYNEIGHDYEVAFEIDFPPALAKRRYFLISASRTVPIQPEALHGLIWVNFVSQGRSHVAYTGRIVAPFTLKQGESHAVFVLSDTGALVLTSQDATSRVQIDSARSDTESAFVYHTNTGSTLPLVPPPAEITKPTRILSVREIMSGEGPPKYLLVQWELELESDSESFCRNHSSLYEIGEHLTVIANSFSACDV